MKKLLLVLTFLLLIPCPDPFAGDAPDWIEEYRRRPVPEWTRKAPVVIFGDECLVEVSKSNLKIRARRAVKVQSSEGVSLPSLAAGLRIKETFILLGAWKVRPDGEVTEYGQSSIVQWDADSSYEFSMSKVNVLRPTGTRVGDLIAWEYLLKSKPEANTQSWLFGSKYPTLESRFGLKLPRDWQYSYRALNVEDLPSSMDDRGFTVWTMRNQPAVAPEPLGVPFRDLVPRIIVSYTPSTGKPNRNTFDTWSDLGSWYGDIVGTQVVSDDSIRQAVSSTVSDSADLWRATGEIASFVQGIRYLDVAPGRSVAEPHPAPEILRNRYGDCEDKSVLTITMLREIGVEAYPVIALTKDVGSVVPDIPTPSQFNHVLTAIKPPGPVGVSAEVDVEGLGRVVIFDPTDPYTGLGDLSESIQGTRALIVHDSVKDLILLPVLPPGASRREAEIRVTIPPEGDVDVRSEIKYTGGYAARMRGYFESVRPEKRKMEYHDYIRSRFGRGEVRDYDVSGVESPADPIVSKLDLKIPLPGKDLGILKTLSTQFLLPTRARSLPDKERETPLRIGSGFQEWDRTIVEIPSGWKFVAPPESVKATSPVGEYELRLAMEGENLVIDRRLSVGASTVTPEGYREIRDFFQEVARGDATEIALEKTSGAGS